jgi:basic amino acid/polyamine antiporter, APA family
MTQVLEKSTAPTLARTMGLATLVVYGVGDMIGSGIYGTVGVAAGAMGNAVWIAFVTSMIAALLTGLSYASIASRYPRAGGAAYVTQRAFHLPYLSYLIGLTVTASGLTSMATAGNVFAESLQKFIPAMPVWVVVLAFIALLTFINFWGIRESMWMNLMCTMIEVGGLLLVIAVGARYWGSVNYLETPPDLTGRSNGLSVLLIMNGAVLTFFAFVGFEDMLNVAEEVKNPTRTMPWAIVLSLIIVTGLYIAVSVTAVSVVDYHRLSDAKFGAPLVQITGRAAPWLSPWVYTAITLFAVANSALINYIMGSRLIYGMSRQGLVPQVLGRVHPRRRTPHVAIFVLMLIVAALALSGTIKELASATALLLLGCFVVVNMALIVLKRRPGEPPGKFEVPIFVPLLGSLVCLGLIAARVFTPGARGHYEWLAPVIAASLAAFISLIYLIFRPKGLTEEALAHAEEASEEIV